MATAEIRALHKAHESNLVPMLLNLAALAAAIASLASGWPTGHWLWTVGVIAALVYFQHCWMTIFHEDVHYTLYKGKWHNIRNGMIVGTFLNVPFNVYRQVHIRHHNRMAEPEDWELWPYCDPNKSLRFRRIFIVFDLLFGVWVGSYIYGRVFFVKHTPITDPKMRRRIWLEYGIIVAFWGTIWGLVIAYGAWALFAKVYLIPAFLTGIVQTIRKLTEHLGLPNGDPMLGARTVISKDAVGKAFGYTSFHIATHGMHHKYPQMPHRQLSEAFDIDSVDGKDPQNAPVFPSHFAAMVDMTKHLSRPGIGENVEHDRERSAVAV